MQTKERLSPKSLNSRTREYIPAQALSQPGLRPLTDWMGLTPVGRLVLGSVSLAAGAFFRCFDLLL